MRTTSYTGDAGRERAACLALKGQCTVAVVVPALDEEATVAGVVAPVVDLLAQGLVDEVVVVDGGSRDGTVERAREAGARVVHLADHLATDPHPGKGGGIWAGVRATSSELLLFLDADVAPFDAGWVPAMLGPLLDDPRVQLVKGCYERPVGAPSSPQPGRGGRVTELVARPLLSVLWPELCLVRQPLAGETAARRSLLQELRLASGYGIEIGLLIDTWHRHGVEALAQVDLGERWHAPQSDEALARMAATVLHAALRRLPPDRLTSAQRTAATIVTEVRGSAPATVRYDVPFADLPPIGG